MEIPDDLAAHVLRSLERDPAAPWDDAVWRMAYRAREAELAEEAD